MEAPPPPNVPADMEAEGIVIGACLLSKEATATAMAKLDSADFFCIPYRYAFTAISELAIKLAPVTPQSVLRQLENTKGQAGSRLDEMGGGALILESIQAVDPAEVEFWCDRTKQVRQQRDIFEFADWAKAEVVASKAAGIDALRAKVEERLASLVAVGEAQDVFTMDDDYDDLVARITRMIDFPDEITGLETGWTEFDRATDGFQKGNTSIFYAPSSSMKSFVVDNIGWRLSRHGHGGLWYTTEMPRFQVEQRVLQMEAGVNLRYARQDNQMKANKQKLLAAADAMRRYPIFYCDRGMVELSSMKAEVARYRRFHQIDYTIVDLVDHVAIDAFKDDSVGQQSAIMRGQKDIAKTSDVHVFLVSHISKVDKSQIMLPELDPEAMKGSSSKFQDVDLAVSIRPVVMDQEKGLWRAMTRDEISLAQRNREDIILYLGITKNRHGEIGRFLFLMSMKGGMRMEPLTNHRIAQGQFPSEWDNPDDPLADPFEEDWDTSGFEFGRPAESGE